MSELNCGCGCEDTARYNNCGCGSNNNSCLWIILLLFCCGGCGNGGCGGFDCGC